MKVNIIDRIAEFMELHFPGIISWPVIFILVLIDIIRIAIRDFWNTMIVPPAWRKK